MRIGILETDRLEKDIVDSYGSYAAMFETLLLSVDPGLQFRVYQVMDGEYPQDIDECDAYLITGSKSSVYDEDAWIKKLQAYILLLHKNRKKLVGICFGHQLIGQAFGASVSKSAKGWGVGNRSAKLLQHENWLGVDNDKQEYTLLYSHQDQVNALPGGATLIASNDFCPVASFQVDSDVLTFQGHPEFTYQYARMSLDSRRTEIGETTYKTAIESLQHHNDASSVASWILNFFA